MLAAADAEATAFVNLRYDRARSTIDAVAAGATGAFRDHYVRSASGSSRVLAAPPVDDDTGKVVWSGVADVAPDRATVIVATTGPSPTRAPTAGAGPRDFRLRVDLVQQGGRWLTSDIAVRGWPRR